MTKFVDFCFILFLCSASWAKFISLAINGEAPKLRGGSFAENSLSVNDDTVADGDFLDSGNIENIVEDLSSNNQNMESTDWIDKRLFNELSALKNTKYPLSMETYYYSWKDFKRQHGKKYGTLQEEKTRFQTYVDNHEFVRRHNIEYDQGLKTFSVALNKFSDMTTKEFVNTMNGFRMNLSRSNDNAPKTRFLPPLNFKAPDTVDWREEGYVTPVKDQGHCGSCWAFSSTGALEGQHRRKSGTLISLSEQNLVDCSYKFGNEGCNGGLMDNAFQYIKQNHGVDTEKSYPYEAKEGKCRFKPGTIGADDKGFVDLDQGNETSLMLAIASQGPVSVAMDAGHKSFLHYNKGIYYEPLCSSSELDHGVLAVGYGSTDDGKDYWLIKNSWSTEWGEQGYVRIARNRDNHCGVASQASYPQV